MNVRQIGLWVSAVLAVACSGSGGASGNGNGGGECLEELTDCTATCVGRYLRTCADDKKSYVFEYCSDMICKDGLCQTAACLEPGKVICDPADPSTYTLCLESMTQETVKVCADGTKCQGGACAPVPCQPGEKMCGYAALLTCGEDGNNWKVQDCASGERCDADSLLCTAVDSFCVENPLGSKCQDIGTSVACDVAGGLVVTSCQENEACVDGLCQPRVCGVTYSDGPGADAAGSDGISDAGTLTDLSLPEIGEMVTLDLPPKDIPPLEKPAKATVTITGGAFDNEEVKFTSSKQALYIVKESDLQVGMAKGALMLELHFQGIEEGVVGNFTSEEPGSVTVWIWLNDGTTDQTQIQWKYQSTAFDVTLDQFDPPGGRVIGTFSGSLEDLTGGAPLELTNGQFDVPRKQ